ncbi:hypothetical protein ONS96_013603 [Cadophora gregata f. sp. sojae]|nr:hypothetical protein ONS96_013603 [Cadophora gregata f. sp. sojae]
MTSFHTSRKFAQTAKIIYSFLYIFSILEFTVGQLTGACQRPVLGQSSNRIPTTGQVNVSVIFIDFPDSPTNGSAEALLETLPFSQVTNFLNESSFGQLNLNITAYADKFYHMPGASTSYRYAFPLTTEAHLAYASDAVAAVGTNISFDDTQILFIVPPPASSIPFSTTAFVPLVTKSGKTIPRFVTFGADAFTKSTRFDAMTAALIGYDLGLRPACPPAAGQGAGDPNLGGFSPFCIATPLVPDFLARQKWTLGWLDGETQVTCVDRNGNSSDTAVNSTVTIGAVEVVEDTTKSQTKLAVMALPGGLSLYAEARTLKGLDTGSCLSGAGAGGVLLYYGLATSDATMTDTIYVINPQQGSDTATTGPETCANGLPGFLAPLGLAINQVNNFTIPNTGVRVTVLSQNQEEGTFDVRFESHVQDTASPTTTTASSSTSSATSTSTAKSEATRLPGAGRVLTIVVIPGIIHVANSLW